MPKKKPSKKKAAAKTKKRASKKKKKLSKVDKSIIGAGTGALVAGPVGAVAGAYLGPRVNPKRNPQVQTLDQMESSFSALNPFVVQESVVIEEALPGSRGSLYPLITSYSKDDGGWYSQFSIYLDRGGQREFIVSSPEFEGYSSGEEAADSALSHLAETLSKAADRSDVLTYANPSTRDLSEDEFYLQRDILEFEREMSYGYEAALTELQEEDTNQTAMEAILRCMSAEVGDMMRRSMDDRFQDSVEAYAESNPESIIIDVSFEALSGLKGNLDAMKGSDFTTMTIAEFNDRFLS